MITLPIGGVDSSLNESVVLVSFLAGGVSQSAANCRRVRCRSSDLVRNFIAFAGLSWHSHAEGVQSLHGATDWHGLYVVTLETRVRIKVGVKVRVG